MPLPPEPLPVNGVSVGNVPDVVDDEPLESDERGRAMQPSYDADARTTAKR